MTERKLGFDRATLSDKVKEETDTALTMSAVIARELVQDYPEGKSYKPAEELEKCAWTAEGRWVATMEHPDTGLLTRRSDVKGKISNVQFRKDIMDPKTKRPMVRGIQADITWFKDKVPKQMLDDVKSGALKDVSIGFTYEADETPGEFEGEHYDFAQRNIFIDHLVAPCPVGRCPSPYCGIGVDTILTAKTFHDTESLFKDLDSEEGKDCPVCQRIKEVGLLESAKRLSIKFGSDVLTALEDAPALDEDKQTAVTLPPVNTASPTNTPPPNTPTTTTPVIVPPDNTTTPEPQPNPLPVEESLPSTQELIDRAEELLAMMQKLKQKQVTF